MSLSLDACLLLNTGDIQMGHCHRFPHPHVCGYQNMILQGRDGQIQCDVLGGVEKAQVQHEGGTLQERGLHVTVVVQVGVVPGELQQGEEKLPLVDQGKSQLEEGHMLADRQPVQEWVCKCRVVGHQDRILRLEDQKGVEQLPGDRFVLGVVEGVVLGVEVHSF